MEFVFSIPNIIKTESKIAAAAGSKLLNLLLEKAIPHNTALKPNKPTLIKSIGSLNTNAKVAPNKEPNNANRPTVHELTNRPIINNIPVTIFPWNMT